MRLYDAYKNGEINRTELLAYLDLGYGLYDQVFPTSDRSAEVVTISYMMLDEDHNWTVSDGESMMGYIGPTQDLTNAGTITNSGDILFWYNDGQIVNTGTITNTGNITLKSIPTD